MYITEVLTKTTTGKIAHRCLLLRESYREHGKVKTRTLANLTHCAPRDIAALRWALDQKQDGLSSEDCTRLLERLERDTLSAEDRGLLAKLVQGLPAAAGAVRPTGPGRRRGRPRASHTRADVGEDVASLPSACGGEWRGGPEEGATP